MWKLFRIHLGVKCSMKLPRNGECSIECILVSYTYGKSFDFAKEPLIVFIAQNKLGDENPLTTLKNTLYKGKTRDFNIIKNESMSEIKKSCATCKHFSMYRTKLLFIRLKVNHEIMNVFWCGIQFSNATQTCMF